MTLICKILHPVPEILLVTLCGVIVGADGWEDIEDYGESKLELREFLPFEAGIASDDTLRPFRDVNPEAFRGVFVAFVENLLHGSAAHLIAVDGKTLRRSHDGAVKALHLVSAFERKRGWRWRKRRRLKTAMRPRPFSRR